MQLFAVFLYPVFENRETHHFGISRSCIVSPNLVGGEMSAGRNPSLSRARRLWPGFVGLTQAARRPPECSQKGQHSIARMLAKSVKSMRLGLASSPKSGVRAFLLEPGAARVL